MVVEVWGWNLAEREISADFGGSEFDASALCLFAVAE